MHPTADTTALIFGNLMGRRVMPGVMLLPHMRNPEFWKPIIASVILTPVFILIAIASGGAGHGDFLGAKILFPYFFLLSPQSESSLSPLILSLMLLFSVVQFPLYGLTLALAASRGRFRLLAVGVAVAHVIAATWCVLFFRLR